MSPEMGRKIISLMNDLSAGSRPGRIDDISYSYSFIFFQNILFFSVCCESRCCDYNRPCVRSRPVGTRERSDRCSCVPHSKLVPSCPSDLPRSARYLPISALMSADPFYNMPAYLCLSNPSARIFPNQKKSPW